MNMKRAFLSAVVSLTILFLLALPATSRDETFTDSPAVRASVFNFEMWPGETHVFAGLLHAFAPGDYDTYHMTITEHTEVTFEARPDGFLNTLCVRAASRTECATYPFSIVKGTRVLKPGTDTFFVGYKRGPARTFTGSYGVYVGGRAP